MTDELRIFIADDEQPARERLKELLADVSVELPCRVVGEARNGIEALELLPPSRAQLLLLDIQMPGMGGLEVARHLSQLPEAPAVVFVTAHDRHAVEAFELNALDYLLKPVRAQRLAAALRKAVSVGAPSRAGLARASEQVVAPAGGPREFLSVAERNRIVLVPLGEIIYLKADLKYVTLRTAGREHLIEESLVTLEREFAGRFVRIHRNCLVARSAIRGFERAGGVEEEPHWSVSLEGVGERLAVSRRQWPTLRALVQDK